MIKIRPKFVLEVPIVNKLISVQVKRLNQFGLILTHMFTLTKKNKSPKHIWKSPLNVNKNCSHACIYACQLGHHYFWYRKISNIRRTKSQNLNHYHLVLRSSLVNPLKPSVKSRMKMLLEQRRQAMLQLHMRDRQFNCLLRCDLY